MVDRDEDIAVDFTSHFVKRNVPKQNSIRPNVVEVVKRNDQLPARKQQTKKQFTEPVKKRKAKGQEPKEATSSVLTAGNVTKKRKADRARDTGGHSPAASKERVDKDFWPFEVDYNDHFESPIQAVQDLEPILHLLSRKLKKSPSNLAIYDPFYCQGGIRRHYEQLGFRNFIHRNRDFYKDVESGNLPQYDILVTNPPYSADHKERILEFCLRSRKPWALLLPNYVATKAYFSQLLESTATPAPQRPFFLTPRSRYAYDHPEGTGHEQSPFFSIWYVGLGRLTEAVFGAAAARMRNPITTPIPNPTSTSASKGQQQRRRQQQGGQDGGDSGSVGGGGNGGGGGGGWAVSLARSVDSLRQAGSVPTGRRLNPRQRARLKKINTPP